MTDTNRAIAAVARVLRAPPGSDPDVIAAHVVAALRGIGWRPTAAAPVPPRTSVPLREDRVHVIAAQAREAITRQETAHDHAD